MHLPRPTRTCMHGDRTPRSRVHACDVVCSTTTCQAELYTCEYTAAARVQVEIAAFAKLQAGRDDRQGQGGKSWNDTQRPATYATPGPIQRDALWISDTTSINQTIPRICMPDPYTRLNWSCAGISSRNGVNSSCNYKNDHLYTVFVKITSCCTVIVRQSVRSRHQSLAVWPLQYPYRTVAVRQGVGVGFRRPAAPCGRESFL